MHWLAIQLIILLGFPFLSRRMERKGLLPSWLSPVVLCYAIGILISNLHLFPLDKELSTSFSEITIVLAIPLLLYGTQLKKLGRQAKGTLISFGLCVLSGLIATTMAAFFFRDSLDNYWQLAGMLTGIYTGGTPNMQAIGLALGTSQETIILVNAADVFWGGLYLLLLTSVAPGLYGKILPAYQQKQATETDSHAIHTAYPINYKDALKSILLTLLVVGISIGSCLLIFGSMKQVSFIMLMLTTLSLLASLIPKVQKLENTFETGEYFLLIFCIALGMLADFSEISGMGLSILYFTAIALFSTILLHLVFAYFFKIDRDLFLFTSVAAIYGPAFIGQISSITRNRQLIFAGIAMGLLGYAIGNYLGISMAYLIREMF